MERRRYSERPPRDEYVLTERGRDFRPVLWSLLAWGNRHFAPEGPSVVIVDADTGALAEPMLMDRDSAAPLVDAGVPHRARPGRRRADPRRHGAIRRHLAAHPTQTTGAIDGQRRSCPRHRRHAAGTPRRSASGRPRNAWRWPARPWRSSRRRGWYGHDWWTTGRYIESTDDAYVGGNVTALAPHVSGFIAQVLVTDNQRVKAGQVLVRLDHRDFRAALDHADAVVAARQASLEGCARDTCCSNPRSASRRPSSRPNRRS